MNILLLPGMDGTGIMFEPFVKALPNSIDVQIAKLIQEKNVSYEEQATVILRTVKKNTIVIGESYSGLIAHELGKMAPELVKHIVFAASFLERPSVLAKYGKLLPRAMLNYSLYPESLVKRMLFGEYSSEYLMGLFNRTMSEVPLDVLAFRIKQMGSLEPMVGHSNIAATYFQAKHDNLVSKKSVEVFKKVYANLTHKTIEGSHFVLQTNPKDRLREVLAIAV